MTNYDYLITLTDEKFAESIINLTHRFGSNSNLLTKFLKAEYIPDLTVREITLRIGNIIFSAVSVNDFISKYGSVNENILNKKIIDIRTGRNGNKTIII